MGHEDGLTTLRGTSRAADGIAPPRAAGDRLCAEATCSTRLSVYNQLDRCWIHQSARRFAVRGRRSQPSNAA
jgi:hypothetical protein